MRMTGVSLHSPVCRDAGLGNQGPGMAGLPILLWLDLRIASTSGPMVPESRRGQAAFFILSSPADSSLGGWVLQGGAGPTASGCLGARPFLVARTSADRAGRSMVGLGRPLQSELGWGWWGGGSLLAPGPRDSF